MFRFLGLIMYYTDSSLQKRFFIPADRLRNMPGIIPWGTILTCAVLRLLIIYKIHILGHILKIFLLSQQSRQ